MTTSAAAATAVRAAFAQLIDYAGLFPPAKLPMAPAIAEYAAARRGPFAWMLGRFIVPASRIPELLEALPAGESLALSVILDAGGDPRTWLSGVQTTFAALAALRQDERRVRVEAIEAALPPLQMKRETYDAGIGQFGAARKQAGMDALPAFVELPRDERWNGELDGALFALARHRLGAKLRCGGVVPEAFPSANDVARFICAALQEYGVPVKCTAGLHHPLRHPDRQTGAMMHGFLNVLVAAAFARGGMDPAGVLRILACEDPERFQFNEHGLTWERERVSTGDLQATRTEGFVSYGSCSFAEPTGDLQALGIL